MLRGLVANRNLYGADISNASLNDLNLNNSIYLIDTIFNYSNLEGASLQNNAMNGRFCQYKS